MAEQDERAVLIGAYLCYALVNLVLGFACGEHPYRVQSARALGERVVYVVGDVCTTCVDGLLFHRALVSKVV